jgi:exopolyphosphatase/guanosine-5'-triphosphate,3'-diphosphate pyrophosphatase
MEKTGRARPPPSGRRSKTRSRAPLFAALDLGTNNCRLLMAAPDARRGLRVVDGYSRIVRLGEGLSATGRLGEAAMARTYQALQACAQRIEARAPAAVGCVATQACRMAANGETFLQRVRTDLGLDFTVITPEQEARLSVLGCASLFDPDMDATLIVDIGGGSTELSWVSPRAVLEAGLEAPVIAWASTPLGVVTLAEEESEPERDRRDWYEARVARIADTLSRIDPGEQVREAFARGRAHMIGTSGTVTSLAGVHLQLPRYERAKVDGYWFDVRDCRAVMAQLLAQNPAERAAHA